MEDGDFFGPDDVDALLREAEAFEEPDEDLPFLVSSSSSSSSSRLVDSHVAPSADVDSSPARQKRGAEERLERAQRERLRRENPVLRPLDAPREVIDCDEEQLSPAPSPPAKRFRGHEGTEASTAPATSASSELRRDPAETEDVDALLTSSYGPLAFGFDDWGDVPSITHWSASERTARLRKPAAASLSACSAEFFASPHDLRDRVYRSALDLKRLALPALSFSSLLPPSGLASLASRSAPSSSESGEAAPAREIPAAGSSAARAFAAACSLHGQQESIRVFPVDVRGGGIPFFLSVFSPQEEQRRQRATARACGSAGAYGEDETAGQNDRTRHSRRRTLRRPIQEILREAMEEEAAEAAEKAAEAAEEEAGVSDFPSWTAKRRDAEQGRRRDGVRQWTEKYRARKVVDLLSPPATNRSVLVWLHQWQQRLQRRGKDKKVGTRGEEGGENEETERRRKLLKGNKESDAGRGSKRRLEGTEDDENLPRILLIGGAPGIGKTTLAHVCARHFGFDVVEVNGSDDRSRATLLPLVMNCVTGADSFFHAKKDKKATSRGASSSGEKGRETNGAERAVCERSKKPILLVIDEIDGAAAASGEGAESVVEVIARLVKKKDAKGKPFIKRPVICICIDLYARVLRPLREAAQILNLNPPPRNVLAERLAEILKENQLTADRHLLEQLIDIFEGDVRACINALDFLSRKSLTAGVRELRQEDLELCAIGKDREKHVQDFVRFVFTPPSRSQAPLGPAVDGFLPKPKVPSFLETFDSLAPAVDSHLAPSLLQESFTQVVHSDWTLDKVAYGTELLAFSDCCSCPSLLASRFSFGGVSTGGNAPAASSHSAGSLVPFSLFASHFCVSASTQSFFYSLGKGNGAGPLVSPSVCLYRFFRNKKQACQASIASVASFAARRRPLSASAGPASAASAASAEGEGGTSVDASTSALAAAACADFLRLSFVRDTVSALLWLAVPTPRHRTDFSRLPPFASFALPEAGRSASGGRRFDAGDAGKPAFGKQKDAGEDGEKDAAKTVWNRAGAAENHKRQIVDSVFTDMQRHHPDKPLPRVALGPLHPSRSVGAAGEAADGSVPGSREPPRPASEEEMPLGVRVLSRMAALLTAYGLSFIEVRHENDVSESKAADFPQKRLQSSYRLEPPLDLLLALDDCRMQQTNYKQAQHRSRQRGPAFPPHSAASLSLFSPASAGAPSSQARLGGHSGGRSSTFGSLAAPNKSAEDCFLAAFVVPVVHPLASLSDRACSLLMEAKRLLNADASPSPSVLLKEHKSKSAHKGEHKERGRRKSAGDREAPSASKNGSSAFSVLLEKRRSDSKTTLAAAIVLVREIGWIAFMRDAARSSKLAAAGFPAFPARAGEKEGTGVSRKQGRESANGLSGGAHEGDCVLGEAEDGLGSPGGTGSDEKARLSSLLPFSQGAKKGENKMAGAQGAKLRQSPGKAEESGLSFQRMSFKDFLAEQTAVARAIKRFGCVIHQLPASQKAGKDEERAVGNFGTRSLVLCLLQRHQRAKAKKGEKGDGAATAEREDQDEKENGNAGQPLEGIQGPGGKEAKEDGVSRKEQDNFSVIRDIADMYRACTNGYFKFLEGRCNAVVQAVADDLFL
ncbi:putative ATPase, AAA family domain-containing protein [Neospora caninum Liverpool]|uniref:ATPase, AAA family domain-containing protein,putative n=1 Tax=Neospora caninum (strain Liverpool) TaxID=572307 RepID=F0VJ96_NEOCL|nr:putative ATPase, AAA family domain-containing protein [Neospora caninum Liverpool]CBZ53807.1 putative ATPase, AAA family domain-containing protein [Neospora caninum Liverpool]CEL67801.1 TPA: ATPase, AAA family domain-containing protein,putative [Neospora caninum Liverpool]|eukprot:XP_003883839.1 putative ATPase, AAA family domain-containing protein [Neospora caninum Liverpool]